MRTHHTQRASKALQFIAEMDPSFASLSLWVNHRDVEPSEVVVFEGRLEETGEQIKVYQKQLEFAPAYTDGSAVYYGTEFENWSLSEQVAVVVHELCHVAWRHPARGIALYKRLGPAYKPKVFNWVTDAIINETLRLAGYTFPSRPIFLVEFFEKVFGEKITAQEALSEWDAESLYMRIMREEKSSSGGAGRGNPSTQGSGQGGGAGQGGSDSDPDQNEKGDGDTPLARLEKMMGEKDHFDDLSHRTDETQAEAAQRQSDWHQRLERATMIGRQAGTGLGKIGFRIADMPKPRVPWEILLRRAVMKAITRSPRMSWTRPAKRWIGAEDNARRLGRPTPAYEPGIEKLNGAPRIAVGVDNSMSIGEKEIELFASEIASIGKKTGSEIHLFIFDTEVHAHHKLAGIHFEKEIRNISFARGGGTSFVDVLEKAAEVRPSVIVMLTDLFGPFGEKPDCDVIWASPDKDSPEAPFGKTISLAA